MPSPFPGMDPYYETGAYERELRYSDDELVPPLTPEQQEWAHGVLKAHAERAG